MHRPPARLLAIAAMSMAILAVGCGDEEGDGGGEGAAAFCTEAVEAIDGLATIEVLAPGASRADLGNAHGTIQAELGGASLPSGSPEADALEPAIDDVLALAPAELDSPAGEEALADAREALEAFEAAEC